MVLVLSGEVFTRDKPETIRGFAHKVMVFC
jgi:hypothetical protein